MTVVKPRTLALPASSALAACGEPKPAADAAKAQADAKAKAEALTAAAVKEKEALAAGIEAGVDGLPLVTRPAGG